MRKIGVIGGTFDPIHYGHLAAAEEARIAIKLERVLFVVANVSPHKLDEEVTPVEHRLAMVKLAIASNPHFVMSSVDVDRPGPSYTVDTVSILQQQLGQGTEIYFIMGLDSLVELRTWHQPERLLELCHLVVVRRPGFELDMAQLEASLPGISSRVEILDMPEMDISSTELQERVREGLPIKYQVPPEVERYINDHQLYKRSWEG